VTEFDLIERAEKAARLLSDPLLREGFDLVRKGLHETWEKTPIRDREGAHELRLMLKLLTDVETAFIQAVNDGKVVKFNVEQRRHLNVV
jgi:hypothetical protein